MTRTGLAPTGGQRGFTFVELLVVTLLLGILATLGLLTAQRVAQRPKATATATQMVFMRTGLPNLATNCEGLPLSVDSGGDPGLTDQPAGSTCWSGPYLVRWPETTSFGPGTSFEYQAKKGVTATLTAQSLRAKDARALAAAVRPMFSDAATLTSSKNVWSVSVDIGNFYK